NYSDYLEVSIKEITYQKEKQWANYVLGVIKEFINKGFKIEGIEIVFGGDVPSGSGLSSSAAVEISISSLIMKIFDIELSPIEVIKLSRKAENEFVGVNCGIMDQFSSYLSKENHALLLDCKTLNYRYIPLNLSNYKILLVDTKKERKLSSSVYNKRVEEVKISVEIIRKEIEIEYLSDINRKTLEKFREKLPPVSYLRALHIVEENERVEKSSEFLKKGEIEEFGKLLFSSHESLRNLYEVSCEELDFIVDFSKEFDGVAGARLTGAGFGGCAIVIIKKEMVENFIQKLIPIYEQKFLKKPEIYKVKSVNGPYHRG
ncbi:galactokinase, partial [bacterium]|nr:galactokinase [bacterium]